jgi:WD40 repeat protein
MILTVMYVIVGVQGWCEKTHFFETNRINEVDFSPDRSMFTTSGSSKMMIVWNFTSFQPIFTLTCSSTVQSAKFSKNQQYIAVGQQGSGNVNIIQVSTFTSVFSISTTLSAVYEVDFSWDNSRILICGANAIEVYAVGGSWTR